MARFIRLPQAVSTRFIFAPVAGFLAAGGAPGEVGSPLADLQGLEDAGFSDDGETLRGAVVHVDHFGNLITNIPAQGIPVGASVEVGGHTVSGFATAYASVELGAILAIESSWGTVEIASNGGSAYIELICGVGDRVTVRRGSSSK